MGTRRDDGRPSLDLIRFRVAEVRKWQMADEADQIEARKKMTNDPVDAIGGARVGAAGEGESVA